MIGIRQDKEGRTTERSLNERDQAGQKRQNKRIVREQFTDLLHYCDKVHFCDLNAGFFFHANFKQIF